MAGGAANLEGMTMGRIDSRWSMDRKKDGYDVFFWSEVLFRFRFDDVGRGKTSASLNSTRAEVFSS